MRCLYCNSEESKVIDSRSIDEPNSIRRRRECLGCGRRFTTYESIENIPILVIKRNGERQTFRPEKIKEGIVKACEKRPISMHQIEQMVSRIERDIQNSLVNEISTQEIGEKVMHELKEVDQVAYIRFASVYKKFEDLTTFYDFLDKLKELKKIDKDDVFDVAEMGLGTKKEEDKE